MTATDLVLKLLILLTALTTIFGILLIGTGSLIVQMSFVIILAEIFGYYTIFNDDDDD